MAVCAIGLILIILFPLRVGSTSLFVSIAISMPSAILFLVLYFFLKNYTVMRNSKLTSEENFLAINEFTTISQAESLLGKGIEISSKHVDGIHFNTIKWEETVGNTVFNIRICFKDGLMIEKAREIRQLSD